MTAPCSIRLPLPWQDNIVLFTEHQRILKGAVGEDGESELASLALFRERGNNRQWPLLWCHHQVHACHIFQRVRSLLNPVTWQNLKLPLGISQFRSFLLWWPNPPCGCKGRAGRRLLLLLCNRLWFGGPS